MYKRHERAEGSHIHNLRSGAIHLTSWAECEYCGLLASVVVTYPFSGGMQTSLVVSIKEGSDREIISETFPALEGFVNLPGLCHAELDNCGCVPGSSFSARTRAMIEGLEEEEIDELED